MRPFRTSALLLTLCLTTAAFARAVGAQAATPVPAGRAGELAGAIDAFNARHFADARAILRPLVVREPRNAEAAYWLGRACYADTAWDDAAKWLGRAAELADTSSLYHYWYGDVSGAQAQRAGRLRQPFLAKRVQHEFERAVELDGGNLDAREGLVEFYLQAPGFMGGSVDKAKAQAAEIARRDPYRGAFVRASVARHERDTLAVEAAYHEAVALRPDSAAALLTLAVYYAGRQRWDSAFAVNDRLLERHPENRAARYLVGRLGAQSGLQLDRAEAALRAYLRETPAPGEPTIAGAHWRLGTILERRGDRAGAKAEYGTAVTLDPTLKAAREALARLK